MDIKVDEMNTLLLKIRKVKLTLKGGNPTKITSFSGIQPNANFPDKENIGSHVLDSEINDRDLG